MEPDVAQRELHKQEQFGAATAVFGLDGSFRFANVKPGTYYPMAILLNRYSASASEMVSVSAMSHCPRRRVCS